VRFKAVVLGIIGLTVGAGGGSWEMSRIGIHQGYSPEQPIAFPHKVHSATTGFLVSIATTLREPAGTREFRLPVSA
jgi:hypothetical protein